MEGEGIYTFSDGKVYKGNFKEGKLHGQGDLTFVNEDKYFGNFEGN